MALRLVEVVIPEEASAEADAVVDEHEVIDSWTERSPEGGWARIRVLLRAGRDEPLLDVLDQRFGDLERYRVLVFPVEVALPRAEEPEEGVGEGEEDEAEAEGSQRIGREELHTDLSEAARATPIYLVLIALSSVVCAFGLLKGDQAVIIGAMVIAPLLGPLVALALATTLADGGLARRAVKAGLAGVACAFAVSVAIGVWASAPPTRPALADRTLVDLSDIGLALAAGSAGTLAFTTGVATAVIGVMVAVALVPPIVTAGLLAGAGYAQATLGALTLTAVNLICVNLAGVVTFVARGFRPTDWWEAERARRATRWAIALSALLLLGLVAAILWGPVASFGVLPEG